MEGASIRRTAKRLLGPGVVEPLRERHLTAWPPVRSIRWGSLRRTTPISARFGFDRGTPIDRHYIDAYLAGHAQDVRGAVLEVGAPLYAERLRDAGRAGPIESIDVVDLDPANPRATLVGDLSDGDGIRSGAFDCIICTQTLFLIWDLRAAVANLAAALVPGGVVLVTMPGTSRICRDERGAWQDQWRLTSASARRLFDGTFPAAAVQVEAFGNVLTAIAMLHGIAAEELRPEELRARDPDFEVLIAVRAVRPRA